MAAPSYGGSGARFAHQPKIECSYSYILPPPISYKEEIILEVTFGKNTASDANSISHGYVLIIGCEENYASAIVLIRPNFIQGSVLACRIIRPVTKALIEAIQARSQWIPEAFSEIPIPSSVNGMNVFRAPFSASGMNEYSEVCVLRKVAYNRLPWAIEAPYGLVKEVVGTLQFDNGIIMVRSVDSLKPLMIQATVPTVPAGQATVPIPPQIVHANAAPAATVQIPMALPITTTMHVSQQHYQQQLHQHQQQHRANGLNAN